MAATPILTLSQVRALDYAQMWDAAAHLDATADLWEESFADVHNRVTSLAWEGDAREAELARANADMTKSKTAADAARATATVSRTSASDLAAAQRSVLHVVDYANEAGFRVGEDYSVTDTRTTTTREELAARQAQAQQFAADIRQRVLQLSGLQTEVAGKLTGAAAPISALRFNEAPMPVDNPTTTTPTTPAPKPEPPNCDVDEIAKLHREVDDFSHRYEDFERRVAAHNRKPTVYDANDPVQRQAFAEYQKEEKALVAERTRLENEKQDLREKLGECGIKISANGMVEWPDGSTTTTLAPTPTPTPSH